MKKANPKISSKDLQEKYMQIPKESFDFIRNETNWLPELKQAGRAIQKNRDGSTSLVLTTIKTNSVLTRVLGLEAGDRIELINGRPFSKLRSQERIQSKLKPVEIFVEK